MTHDEPNRAPWASIGLALTALTISMATPAKAGPVTLKLGLGSPVMMANSTNRTYLKIGLEASNEGFERAPVNLGIVLDRSSSMSGEKLERAKEAALMLIDRLSPDDIVSVVAYDSTVDVLVPSTKLINKAWVRSRVLALEPRGSTALFAGVASGFDEVRRSFDKLRVNRVILLSDGQANVGPSSPNELANFGSHAARNGISVTTIGLGLGYNEDLMTALAKKSDGNHDFAEKSQDLARIFDVELKDVLAVVAQEVTVKVTLPEGVRPIASLNRDAEIRNREIIFTLNQLYARQEKFLLVEVEVAPNAPQKSIELAKVDVSYANVAAKGATERLAASVSASFTNDPRESDKSADKGVMVAAIEAMATIKNSLALALRDQGKVDEAEKLLLDNSKVLKEAASKWGSAKLEQYGETNAADAKNLEGESWNQRRKVMRKQQYMNEQQQYH